ncbi:tRNA (adenosine(37)-N6)-threonylcarbamoyltransferase complex dimerization subunit type 1 TsaB [Saccharopolyspora rosea]|uniref:tRNA (Adenosine(37)-N6)-threonylcarbamoyltransferase complex dimerization subunit type 1 TsaB n=1 Tax=Saccharopolyspora rosea TaxID=524884 RepID=A0ABW3FNN2_9PSEU
MLVIALDTSTPAVTAGLVALDDGTPRPLAERVTVNPRAHGELLMPQLLDALAEAGHRLGDADAIVVGSGPGPFTGLRVGMATAAALGQACDRPVHPVCGLDAIAAQAAADGPLLVATDARRKEVYWAAYDAARARTTGPRVQRPADVPVADLGVAAAAGEMAEALGVPAVEPRYPSPVGLVRAAREVLLSGAEPEPLVPLYLRRPDAATPGPRKSVVPGRGAR